MESDPAPDHAADLELTMYHPELMSMIAKDRIEDMHRSARSQRLAATCRGPSRSARIWAWLRRPSQSTELVGTAPVGRTSVSTASVADARDSVVDLRDPVVYLLDTEVHATEARNEGVGTSVGADWFVGTTRRSGRLESWIPDGPQHAVAGTGRTACTDRKVAFVFLSRSWSGVAQGDRCPACTAVLSAGPWVPRQGRYEVPDRIKAGSVLPGGMSTTDPGATLV